MPNVTIRPCRADDAARVCDIYNHYVRDTIVTFEEEPVDAAEMARRIDAVTRELPWLVLEDGGVVAGYAYAAPWKARSAYRFSVETTIYLAPEHIGRGLGRPLYEALLAALRELDVHSVIGGAALPNPASAALHERCGFVQVAHFKDVGFKLGRWIDVAYWELIL
jgi:L-amino acid N-acyltransferase YncA